MVTRFSEQSGAVSARARGRCQRTKSREVRQHAYFLWYILQRYCSKHQIREVCVVMARWDSFDESPQVLALVDVEAAIYHR